MRRHWIRFNLMWKRGLTGWTTTNERRSLLLTDRCRQGSSGDFEASTVFLELLSRSDFSTTASASSTGGHWSLHRSGPSSDPSRVRCSRASPCPVHGRERHPLPTTSSSPWMASTSTPSYAFPLISQQVHLV